MVHAQVWWRRPWVLWTEHALGHIAAVVVGFVLMIVGLALGVTMIMLPVGLVVGFAGLGLVIAGLFARFNNPN